MEGNAKRGWFGLGRRSAADAGATDVDVDRIVAIRLTRATRRTERLLRRIDALERRVKDLEAQLARVEPRFERLEPAAEQPQPRRERTPAPEPPSGRFERSETPRPQAEPGVEPEGVRIVASQLLESGLPAEQVSAHLQEHFHLSDASRVVEEVAAERS
jgi:hypothetical protein